MEGLNAEGAGTEPGTYSVKVSGKATVLDAEGQDVTRQFIVNTENGILDILAPAEETEEVIIPPSEDQLIVFITGNHEERVYNKMLQSVSGYTA